MAHIITLHVIYSHPGINISSTNLFIETHNGTHLCSDGDGDMTYATTAKSVNDGAKHVDIQITPYCTERRSTV